MSGQSVVVVYEWFPSVSERKKRSKCVAVHNLEEQCTLQKKKARNE
jgi:hypothetical protein